MGKAWQTLATFTTLFLLVRLQHLVTPRRPCLAQPVALAVNPLFAFALATPSAVPASSHMRLVLISPSAYGAVSVLPGRPRSQGFPLDGHVSDCRGTEGSQIQRPDTVLPALLVPGMKVTGSVLGSTLHSTPYNSFAPCSHLRLLDSKEGISVSSTKPGRPSKASGSW